MCTSTSQVRTQLHSIHGCDGHFGAVSGRKPLACPAACHAGPLGHMPGGNMAGLRGHHGCHAETLGRGLRGRGAAARANRAVAWECAARPRQPNAVAGVHDCLPEWRVRCRRQLRRGAGHRSAQEVLRLLSHPRPRAQPGDRCAPCFRRGPPVHQRSAARRRLRGPPRHTPGLEEIGEHATTPEHTAPLMCCALLLPAAHCCHCCCRQRRRWCWGGDRAVATDRHEAALAQVDNGITWSKIQILARQDNLTRAQPTPVIDCKTGMIHLSFANWRPSNWKGTASQ